MRDVILGPGTNSLSSATWCCSPMETWTPWSAAMRRMQVQARSKVTCVMPPVFCRRRPACGLAGGRDSKEQELRGTGSAVLVLIRARNATRNATAREPLRCDEYRKQSIELSTAMVFVQRACGVKEGGSIAYSTVVCSANVIAVSYQRTGSFRSDPVDTGRALAKTLCQNRVQHRATVNATCKTQN